ncbi:hypothetical protein HTY54_18425 [Escherichia coli]|nr:hypothetical protein [Escherichia coli]
MQENEKLYQLPGSELLLVLSGPETEGRLQHMVNILNSRQIHWNNTGLDMGYGAARGAFLMEIRKPCNPLLGQLSWLAEQSCAHHHVLALDSREEMVSGQTTKQVLLLNTIRTALESG